MITTDIQTLTQRFMDEWNDAIPAFYDGQKYADPDGPYALFSVIPGSTQRYAGSTTNGTMLSRGRVWLRVFIPPQTGEAVAQATIDHFTSIFINWESADGALQCATPQHDAKGTDSLNKMTMFKVTVPYVSVRHY